MYCVMATVQCSKGAIKYFNKWPNMVFCKKSLLRLANTLLILIYTLLHDISSTLRTNQLHDDLLHTQVIVHEFMNCFMSCVVITM